MRPQRAERIAFVVLGTSTLLVVIPIIWVVVMVLVHGIRAISWEFLTAMPRMGMRAGGIFPAIVGTVYLVILTMVFALPLGIGAAIYLSEYARANRLRRVIEASIINLAGVPSVVYGLFGLGLFVLFLHFGTSLLAGSLTLALLVLPVIITVTREALQRVPQAFREVSLSLGATKWQTIRQAVLPNALPGILTGTVLEVGRAAGETAPILFTVAAFYLPRLPNSIFDQVMVLPYHLYILSTQVPNVRKELQYGTALVLILLVLVMNLVAAMIRARARKRKVW